MEEHPSQAQIVRRKLDNLIEQNKTKTVIRFLNREKKKLLPLRLRLETRNGRFSTAAKACWTGNLEVFEAVVNYNDGMSPKTFSSCLNIVLKLNHIKILEKLLKIKSVNVKKMLNTPLSNKKPPLFEARSGKAAELLLKAGADKSTFLNDYWNALDWAIEHKRHEVTKVLVNRGLEASAPQRSFRQLLKPRTKRGYAYYYDLRTLAMVAEKANNRDRQLIINELNGKSLAEKRKIVQNVKQSPYLKKTVFSFVKTFNRE